MRPSSELALIAALAAWLVAAPAGAEDAPVDAAKEARLSAAEGKFREADGIVERAPPEVQNDPALRLALGETAMRFAHTRTGEEKREALNSASHHFCKVIELNPADPRAAAGALQSAKELGELEVAARNFDQAKLDAKIAIEAAEKSVAAGVSSPEFKLMLGRMYGFRASFIKTMKDVDMLDKDSAKAASLLAEVAAAGSDEPGKLLSEASGYELRAAHLIHEGIPVDTETRDDKALATAIELATKACELKSADEPDFVAHLNTLRLAHSWGMKLPAKPYMTPLGPPLTGLKLELPRSGGWTRGKHADWELLLERDLHDPKNDGRVQIMIKEHKANEMSLGKPWNQINEIAPRRFDVYKEEFTSPEVKGTLGTTVAPVQLAGAKNAPEVWFYEVSGSLQADGKMRTRRTAEWLWFGSAKKDFVWQMKILDWRPVADLEDPDIVAFVASAIGEGLWPPGAKGKDDGKKDPPKKPPTKKK